MNILITGSEGLSALITEALVKRTQSKALVYNSFNLGEFEQINKDVLKNIEVITGDVRTNICPTNY